MNRTVQHITRKLIDLLPENEQYYRLDELRELQFPAFIVKRIKIELERNLAESMILPDTDWANKESEAVLQAWQQFVEAIHAEARLPASYAKAVIETAVADVLEMLVQPRKNIPGVIFATDKKLEYGQLHSRLDSVVVYRHFGTILLRYMEKREARELTKEKCREIIGLADEKMTKRYSPLNWAQMMDPLFSLLENSIDTNLLRLFFEDKNMPREARRFDLMEGKVTRAQLIETLSSPELLNFEGYEEDQSSFFDRLKNQQKESVLSESGKDKNNTEPGSASNPEENEENIATVSPADSKDAEEIQVKADSEVVSDEEDSLNKIFTEDDEESPVIIDEEEPDESLNSIFQEEDEEIITEETDDVKDLNNAEEDIKIEEDEEFPEVKNKKVSAYDIGSFRKNKKTAEPEDIDKAGDAGEEDEDFDEEKNRPGSEKNKPFEEIKGEDEDGETMLADFGGEPEISEPPPENEETPMWMRFVDPEEQAEEEEQLSGIVNDEDGESDTEEWEEDAVEDGFIDEPIIDLRKDEKSSGGEEVSQEREKLYEQLASDRELFVDEIFRGSERAFEEAIEEISTYKTWKSVSKYIQKDVFKRNLVDMYSEAAVEFTDRLQSYFLEKQNHN